MLRRNCINSFRRVHSSVYPSPASALFSSAAAVGSSSSLSCSSQQSAFLMMHKRNINWNPFSVKRETDTPVEAELPEIFAEQPEEIDDYIRPERSSFEVMEDWWEWAASFMDPVEKNANAIKYLHNEGLFGIVGFSGWGPVFLFWGVCLRLIGLIPSLYAHRNGLRMAQIQGPLNEINQKESTLKNDKTISSVDRRVVSDGYKRVKKALYKKHNCAQWKTGVSMVSTPLMISSFMAIRRLTVYEDDLEHAGFLWVADLTMPDPTFLLPVICSTLFVVNFELNQAMNSGNRSNTSLYLKWGCRVGSLGFAYAASAQPAALFAYWIGMSCAGMLQPLLLRNQKFRDLFNMPDPPAAAKSKIGELPKINLQQGFLSKLFGKKMDADEKKKLREDYAKEQEKIKQRSFQRANDMDIVFDDEEDVQQSSKADKKQIKK